MHVPNAVLQGVVSEQEAQDLIKEMEQMAGGNKDGKVGQARLRYRGRVPSRVRVRVRVWVGARIQNKNGGADFKLTWLGLAPCPYLDLFDQLPLMGLDDDSLGDSIVNFPMPR